jgi:ADP-ribose pyrophosphatase
LELPAGTLEKGEAASACARRELREETGFSCRTLKRIGAIFPVPGYSTEKIILFKATALFPSPAEGDPDEVVERRVLTAGEVKRSFLRGRIRDAKTIAGLARCRLL